MFVGKMVPSRDLSAESLCTRGMSIPLITLMAPALDGGIGRNIVNLANAFHEMGYAVHVLLNKPVGPYLQLLRPGVSIHHLRRNHHVFGIPSLAAYLLKHEPSVILTPVPRQTILALRTRRLLFAKTRVYVNVHNTYSRTFQLLSARKGRTRIRKIRHYYPRSDGIVAVSNGVAEDLCELTGLSRDLVTVINNPIVTGDLAELAAAPVDHPWFAADQPPVLLCLARLEPQKNLPLAIAAFEAVRNQVPCRLVIIGDGTQRDELERRAAQSPHAQDIALLGHQGNPFRFLARAAILVSASSWEGFGNVLAEALATGTAVVATDCPSGPRDILDNGRYGALVPMNDAPALADAILRTLSKPPATDMLKNAARRYDAHAVARAYLARFGLVAKEPRPSSEAGDIAARAAEQPPGFAFTIFVPTFNRAHTLPRAFRSIEQQTFRDFEVLIIDDGSNDGTNALVETWRAKVDFPVVYHWQPNQGKSAAHNAALSHLRGELTVMLDSDDMLVPEALERLHYHWQQIPASQRSHYAGVEGLCAHMDDHRIAGDRFPQDVFDSDYIEMRRRYGVRGDKKNCVRSDLLRLYPYPRFEGERHIRPSLLWERLSLRYKFRYINEVIELIEYQEGGLSHDRFGLRMCNPQGFRYYYKEESNVLGKNDELSRRFDHHVKYVRYSLHCGIGLVQQARDIDSPVLWLVALPMGTLTWLRDKIRLRHKKA